MISRHAENCFWLGRHLERADNASRFLMANYLFVLDANIPDQTEWFPFIVVSGEEVKFLQQYSTNEINSEIIQNYLAWDKSNPVSILSTLENLRHNAIVTRDIIGSDLWGVVNKLWLWINKQKTQKIYNQNRVEFHKFIKRTCEEFYGIYYTMMPTEKAYYFILLGMMMERIDQMTRILSVKWSRPIALLQLCGANDAFSRKRLYPTNENMLDFMVFEQTFPHSVLFCLGRAIECIENLSSYLGYNVQKKIIDLTISLQKRETKDTILLMNQSAEICEDIQRAFYESHTPLTCQMQEGEAQ